MIYEQPLNEQVRLCLRLEYLFKQADYFLTKEESVWDFHQSLKTILEILQTIDRPDLKSKFCQTLNQYIHTLTQLEKSADVDKQKLNNTLKKIDQIIDGLHANSKKIGQELRDNEFLATIQQRLQTPGGTCSFSLPEYHAWLQQDKNSLQKHLTHWFSQLSQLKETVTVILKLLRDSTTFKKIESQNGFYQSNLDAHASYQLIRIDTPDEKILPDISIGRYRLAIHFFSIDITGKTSQVLKDVTFGLACCKM